MTFDLGEGRLSIFTDLRNVSAVPEKIDVKGLKFTHLSDHIALAAYLLGDWEPEIQEVIREHLPHDGIVLDIGANIGLHALPLSRRCAKVYAFEPFPATALRLAENIVLNGVVNVEVVRKACSDHSGKAKLYLPPPEGDSRRNRNLGLVSLAQIQSRSLIESIPVEEIRIDDMEFERVDVMKIDVEGFEGSVLAGGHTTIARYRPTIVMEWSVEGMSHSRCNADQTWALIRILEYDVSVMSRRHGVRNVATLSEMPAYGNLLLHPK